MSEPKISKFCCVIVIKQLFSLLFFFLDYFQFWMGWGMNF